MCTDNGVNQLLKDGIAVLQAKLAKAESERDQAKLQLQFYRAYVADLQNRWLGYRPWSRTTRATVDDYCFQKFLGDLKRLPEDTPNGQ